MDKERKMAELKALADRIATELCEESTRPVWGEGSLDARLVMVGEAPGAEETRLGRPFVGVTGKVFRAELEASDISAQDIYITATVKCRPIQKTNGMRNRSPNRRETEAWLPILLAELEIVSPVAILCLGGVAASALIHKGFAVESERGKRFEGPFGIASMATYHPSYLRRGKPGEREGHLRLFRQDLAAALAASDAT